MFFKWLLFVIIFWSFIMAITLAYFSATETEFKDGYKMCILVVMIYIFYIWFYFSHFI